MTGGRDRVSNAGVKAIWDKVAEGYDAIDVSAPDYQASLQVLFECLGDPQGRSFCEVGCGSGTISALLAVAGAVTTLVDISDKSLEFARAHFERLGVEARFCLEDALSMSFQDGCFDVVWNAGVIEHFPQDGKVALIREMWRVVKPGGLLFITAPNALDIPYRIGKAMLVRCGKWEFGREDPVTPGGLRRHARKAGVPDPQVFAYNPVIGWWFLGFGRRLTDRLGLNKPEHHKRRCRLGHVLCLLARKAPA